MIRTLLLIIALVVLIGIALVALGIVNLTQTDTGKVAVETRDVQVGTTTKNVAIPVPTISTESNGGAQPNAAPPAQAQPVQPQPAPPQQNAQ